MPCAPASGALISGPLVSRPAEHHDAVAVSAAPIISNAPNIRGLGEALFMKHHLLQAESGCEAERHHVLFELDLALAYFADLEGNDAIPARDPVQFAEYRRHHRRPILDAPCHCDAGRNVLDR